MAITPPLSNAAAINRSPLTPSSQPPAEFTLASAVAPGGPSGGPGNEDPCDEENVFDALVEMSKLADNDAKTSAGFIQEIRSRIANGRINLVELGQFHGQASRYLEDAKRRIADFENDHERCDDLDPMVVTRLEQMKTGLRLIERDLNTINTEIESLQNAQATNNPVNYDNLGQAVTNTLNAFGAFGLAIGAGIGNWFRNQWMPQ
jgi:hypothetical protein